MIIVYVLISIINVFLHIVRSILVIKSGKLIASLSNCICYTFSAIVIKFISEVDLWIAILVQASTNFLGCYLAMLFCEHIIKTNKIKDLKTMNKRQQEKLEYIEKHAELAMQSICKSFHKDIPNHLVTAGYRKGFDDGYNWYMNHPLGVLDEDYVWAIYNFVNDWKSGEYGEIELQKALKDNFKF